MTIAPFEAVPAILGGLLVGAAAGLLLLFNGRVAGMSGVVAGVVRPKRGDVAWRLWFLAGLAVGALVMLRLRPGSFDTTLVRSPWALIAAGVLVGYGTRLANGCTSGHGLCGLGRASRRSLVATLTFIGVGALTVFAVRHWFGAVL